MGDQVYLFTGKPWDSNATVTYPAPPWPFGKVSAGFDSSLDFDIIGNIIGYQTGGFFASAGRRGYTSQAADLPPSTYFPPRLLSIFSYQAKLFDSVEPQPRTRPGFGEISVENGDGKFNSWLNYGWDGRDLEIWRGDQTLAFSTFVKVFRGTCDGIEQREDRLVFRMRDRDIVLDVPIQTDLYGGTGGYQGDSNLGGRPRPQSYGVVKNVELLQISAAFLVYQWHDRTVNAVTEVRDKGVPLTFSGVDASTFDGLTAMSIAGGQFATCNALGLVRLGATPVGTCTIDGNGDAQPSYVQTTADIVQRIVQTRLGTKNIVNADLSGFAAFNVDQGGTIGLYISNPTNVSAVLDDLLRAAGGWWQFNLLGQLKIQVYKAPGTSVLTFFKRNIGTPLVTRFPVPSSVRRLGYQRVWRAQTPAELVQPPSITEANRQFWGKNLRYVQAANNAIDLKHLLARSVSIDGFFDSQSVAQTEVERQNALYSTERGITTWRLLGVDPFAVQLGDTITYQDPAAVQTKYNVVGVIVDANTDSLTVDLWK